MSYSVISTYCLKIEVCFLSFAVVYANSVENSLTAFAEQSYALNGNPKNLHCLLNP